VFLKMRGVVFDWFVVDRRVPFAVVTLHFFGRSPAALTVEVDCHKRDPGGNESVAFSREWNLWRPFGSGLTLSLLPSSLFRRVLSRWSNFSAITLRLLCPSGSIAKVRVGPGRRRCTWSLALLDIAYEEQR
jgi:hypothetical protein